MSFQGKTKQALRDVYESLGAQGTMELLRDMCESGKLKPEDVSVKELFEAVGTTDFPVLQGELINAKLVQGFQSASNIADQLATVWPSKMAQDKIGRYKSAEGPDEILEGTPYNDSTLGEDFYVPLPSIKMGRILSVSEECLYFDRTGELMNAVRDIARELGNAKEKLILEAVQDAGDLAGRVYRPQNVDTALFSATIGNLVHVHALRGVGRLLGAGRDGQHRGRQRVPHLDPSGRDDRIVSQHDVGRRRPDGQERDEPGDGEPAGERLQGLLPSAPQSLRHCAERDDLVLGEREGMLRLGRGVAFADIFPRKSIGQRVQAGHRLPFQMPIPRRGDGAEAAVLVQVHRVTGLRAATALAPFSVAVSPSPPIGGLARGSVMA